MSYELTNTEKRRKETEALKDLHPKVKNVVFDVKKNFYDSDGANLSDRYELILRRQINKYADKRARCNGTPRNRKRRIMFSFPKLDEDQDRLPR